RNWPSAGTKSPEDRPCRYNSGTTSLIFGVLRIQGGRIAEQDRRAEPPALAGVGVNPSVVDPRRDYLHRPGAGQNLSGLVTTIAHHQPPAPLVALADEPVDVGIHL